MRIGTIVGMTIVVATTVISSFAGAVTISIDDSTETIKGTIDNANCQDVSAKTLEEIQCTTTVPRVDYARNQVFRIVLTEGAPDADPVIISDRAILSFEDIAFTTDATLTFAYQSEVQGTPLGDSGGVPHIKEAAGLDLDDEFRQIQGFKAPDNFVIGTRNDIEVPEPATIVLLSVGALGVFGHDWLWRRASARGARARSRRMSTRRPCRTLARSFVTHSGSSRLLLLDVRGENIEEHWRRNGGNEP